MSTNKETAFRFGRNWESFVNKHFSEERISLAQESLRDLLGLQHLKGRTFLDVGCGSGLFSIAAVRMGAEQVISFDCDADSVKIAEGVRARCNIAPDRWHVFHGSLLDDTFLVNIEPADVVYCWGVAHHTGDMWRGIDNLVHKVKPGGLLEIAIYNKVERSIGGSSFWLKVKKAYNRSPVVIQKAMEWMFVANFIMRHLITFRSPWAAIRNYPRVKKGRGMDFSHDVRDWLGGYPYEYATAGEVIDYLHGHHKLCLERLTTSLSIGCNEFVFSTQAPAP